MRYPSDTTPWPAIHAVGFQHVICLDNKNPAYDAAPLAICYAEKLKDLAHGGQPEDPVREERLIHEAVEVAISRIQAGEGVVIHCRGGRGRTGTVIGCVLRVLGYPSKKVVSYLDDLHKKRCKTGWPESVWQSQLVERFQLSI